MSRSIHHPYSMHEIARRLKCLRKVLDYTQETMGRVAGVSGNAWSNYEKGWRRIEIDAVIALWQQIGVTPDWVYLGRVNNVPAELARRLEECLAISAKDDEKPNNKRKSGH